MAPLTWRNVSTPNFGDSVAALGLAGRSIDRGFTGLSEALGKFSDWRTEQNDRTVLANAQRIQDPNAFRDALQSGTVLAGIDPTQLSARTLGLLDARRGTLIQTDQAGYEAQRTQNTNRILDDAGAASAALSEAVAGGDPARIAAARANLARVSQALPADQQMRLATQGQSLESGAVGIQGARQGQTIRQWEFDRAQATEADRQTAQALVQQATNEDWNSEAATQRILNGNLTPGAQALAIEALRGRFPGLMPNAHSAGQAPVSGSGAGGTPARAGVASGAGVGVSAPATPAAGNPNAVYGNGIYGRPPRELTTMSLGEVIDFGQNTLIPNTRGRVGAGPDRGSSASGAFQITGETIADYAPRVLGPNWRNENYTYENQLRIARAIYEDRRNGDLTQTWRALEGTNVPGTNTPANTAGAFRNVPFEAIAPTIMRRESGGGGGEPTNARTALTAATAIQSGQGASQEIAVRRGEVQAANPLAARYLELAANGETIGEAATRLRTNNFPDLSHAELVAQLTRLIENSPNRSMRAAQAAAILADSPQAEGNSTVNSIGWLGRQIASPRRTGINQDRADALSRFLTSGDGFRAAEEDRALGAQAAAIDNARTRVETISAERERLLAAIPANRNLASALPDLEARLADATERLTTLVAVQRARTADGAAPSRPSWFSRPGNQAAQRTANPPGAARPGAPAANPASANAPTAPGRRSLFDIRLEEYDRNRR